jgi:aspartate aminotransferase
MSGAGPAVLGDNRDGLKILTLDRPATSNPLSARFAMPGLQFGLALGTRRFAALVGETAAYEVLASGAPYAAVAALDGPQDFVSRLPARFAERRDLVQRSLRDVPGLSCHAPEGAFYVYPSCADLIGRRTPEGQRIASDEDLVEYLLDAAGVSTVAGAAYGLSPRFRVSYAVADERLAEACKRIARACAELPAN